MGRQIKQKIGGIMSNRRVREAKRQVEAKRYQFRESSAVRGVDAQTVGEELERIHAQHGVLQASVVVDEARPEDAPLHPAFEWRDKIAAEQYRVWQARNIIKSVEVVVQVDGKPEASPVYVHCPQPQEDRKPNGYQPVSVVVNRPDLYAIALGEAARKLAEAEASLDKLKRAAESAQDCDRDRLAKIAVAMETARALSAAVQALH